MDKQEKIVGNEEALEELERAKDFHIDEPLVEQEEDLTIEEEHVERTLGGRSKKDADKLKKLKEEKQEYLDGWQRARAEMTNLKKQHAEERAMFTSLGKQSLLEELLPVLDNFDAAFSNKESWEQVPETWRVGVEYIQKQFIETLENNGVMRFGAVGDTFDAKAYEPVEVIEGEKKDTVIEVLQSGYKIKDKVVRPARVKIGG